MKVGIIGGGISGVSLASKLSLMDKSLGLDVTLFEAKSKLGGTIDSVHKDGYVIEAGTNGFLDSKPFSLEVFNDAGLADKLLASNDSARRRFIQRYSKLQELPSDATTFFLSKMLTLKGKMRLAMELFIPQRKDGVDESLAEFAKRRLGEEALDYMIGPMVSGIFAGDPEKMSLRSCFPVIANLERDYGGLIKGMIKKRKKTSATAGPGGVLTAYVGGMGEAVKDLGKKCAEKGVNILFDSPVTNVRKSGAKYIVTSNSKEYEFDRLAITCPSYESAQFLQQLDGELAGTLGTIPYAPIFVAGLGYSDDGMMDDINGFGYLIPTKENRQILGALFTSSMFPSQAPKGKKFLRVLSGGDKHHELMKKSDEELLEISIRDVTDILGIVKKPEMIQTFRYEHAIPQYHVGHSLKVKKIEDACERLGNIYIGGNVLYGIGLNDCTKTSKIIAEKIRDSIR